jgi:hypothetical protein
MTKKLELPYVREQFGKRGWQCLATHYVNNLEPLDCVCDQGHVTKITWCNFKKNQGCRYCAGNATATLDEVRAYFKSQGCELLSSSYANAFSAVEYRCVCGTEAKMRYVDFQRGHRCSNCMAKTISEMFRTPKQELVSFCEQQDCRFIRAWIKCKKTRIEYVCKCGNTAEAYWTNFKNYPNCKKCGNKKVSGDNNYMWNPDREEVARRKRFRKTCEQLIRRVMNATGGRKADRSAALLGYTPKQLQEHILSHPNMASLQGKEWHIDHIFPIQAFLDHGIEDLRLINALDNLQPLEDSANIAKGDLYERHHFEEWIETQKKNNAQH